MNEITSGLKAQLATSGSRGLRAHRGGIPLGRILRVIDSFLSEATQFFRRRLARQDRNRASLGDHKLREYGIRFARQRHGTSATCG